MKKRLLCEASLTPLSYTRHNDKYLCPRPVQGSSWAPTEGSAALTRYGAGTGGHNGATSHFPSGVSELLTVGRKPRPLPIPVPVHIRLGQARRACSMKMQGERRRKCLQENAWARGVTLQEHGILLNPGSSGQQRGWVQQFS